MIRTVLTNDATLVRIAVPKKPQVEGSAHFSDKNYDPTQAQSIVGDLAENNRKYLADKLHCRPPGLSTETGEGGSIVVRADNPEVGVGVTITIEILGSSPAGGDTAGGRDTGSPDTAGQGMGFGPAVVPSAPPTQASMAPPLMSNPAPPPPPQNSVGGMGFGPQAPVI